MLESLLEELQTFPGREEGLRKIMRFSLEKTSFYRSSDFSHSKRVAWHVAEVDSIVQKMHPGFDTRRALAMALVHDDAELITGDHQAGNKSKMSPEQLAALERQELEAIQTLAERFPKTLDGYVYRELLEDVLHLNTKEAQVTKYLDRQDALGECLHELYAGNATWTQNVVNEFGVIPTPFDFYYAKQPSMITQFPSLVALKGAHPFFETPEKKDWVAFVQNQTPHTKESIRIDAGHPQYDAWKKIVLESGDSEEIENLYTQREFI
jgi:5'-deoxynucleotidase YfbR-like HD superfamily hydrolase